MNAAAEFTIDFGNKLSGAVRPNTDPLIHGAWVAEFYTVPGSRSFWTMHEEGSDTRDGAIAALIQMHCKHVAEKHSYALGDLQNAVTRLENRLEVCADPAILEAQENLEIAKHNALCRSMGSSAYYSNGKSLADSALIARLTEKLASAKQAVEARP